MTQLKNVVPHIPSKNMEETANCLDDWFGFKTRKYSDFYTEMVLDGFALGILPAQGEPNEQSLYLCVDNVDKLWEQIGPKLAGTRFKAPFDREYGMREAHIIIPHTNTLLFIGHSIHV